MKKKIFLVFLSLTLLSVLLTAANSNARVYVVAGKAGGDGSSWETALGSLKEAIEIAGAGGEIWVAKGTYSPSQTLYPQNQMTIYGGFAGNEDSLAERDVEANPTTVDGRSTLEHVFFIRLNVANVRLDGLIIINGNANANDESDWGDYGGGVFVDLQPAVIANCKFSANFANKFGGAICLNRSDTHILNCEFAENMADMGGGVYAFDADVKIIGSTFSNNTAQGDPAADDQARGGGLWVKSNSLTEVQQCVFVGNYAVRQGGALEIASTPSCLLKDCSFEENHADTAGGAVCILEAEVVVETCNFIGNYCNLDNGGAFYSFSGATTIRKSLFARNHAVHGGAVQLDYSLPQADLIEKCRFFGNWATVGGGALHSFARNVTVENTIFSGNYCEGSGGGIRFHAGLQGTSFNPDYVAVLKNCVIFGNSATDWGGGVACTGALPPDDPTLFIYNTVMWNNNAGETFWDEALGEHVPSKDIANLGSMALETWKCDIETLTWEHGSTEERHFGSFTADPLFVDADGPDDVLGSEDDDFTLQNSSPCLDHAAGDFAPETDLNDNPRFDIDTIENQGSGSPNYVDIGCFELIYPPVAGFVYSSEGSCAPLLMAFSDTSTNDPVVWQWDFGGGATSCLQNPEHIFMRSGNYTITLEVANAAGSDVYSETLTILPCEDGPVQVDGINYDSLDEAYNNSDNQSIIKLHAADHSSIDFNREINVVCQGGFNCGFSEVIAPATISGKMTISSGTIIIDGVFIVQ